MANIFLTPTAEFKPFSYAEMLAPIAAYQEAYDKYDDQLNTLAEDAATKAFNFAAQDTKEKAQYDALMNRLKASADSLLTNGLNADIMREIRSINKDYRTSMIPLHQKIAKRAELAKAQRDALEKNSNLRFTIDYSKANLDDIHAGSTYNIIDLDSIYESTAKEYSGITSKNIRTDFDPIPIGKTGYSYVTTGYGYTPHEFNIEVNKEGSLTNELYKRKVAEIMAWDVDDKIKQEAIAKVQQAMFDYAGEFKTEKVGVTGQYSKNPNSTYGKPGHQGGPAVVEGEVGELGKMWYNNQVYTGTVVLDENGNKTLSEKDLKKVGTKSDEEIKKDMESAKVTQQTKTDAYGNPIISTTVTYTVPQAQADSLLVNSGNTGLKSMFPK